MIAILMAPQTIPSRFSLVDEAGPLVRPGLPATSRAASLAAGAARLLRRLGTAPAARPHASSAAAW